MLLYTRVVQRVCSTLIQCNEGLRWWRCVLGNIGHGSVGLEGIQPRLLDIFEGNNPVLPYSALLRGRMTYADNRYTEQGSELLIQDEVKLMY